MTPAKLGGLTRASMSNQYMMHLSQGVKSSMLYSYLPYRVISVNQKA